MGVLSIDFVEKRIEYFTLRDVCRTQVTVNFYNLNASLHFHLCSAIAFLLYSALVLYDQLSRRGALKLRNLTTKKPPENSGGSFK